MGSCLYNAQRLAKSYGASSSCVAALKDATFRINAGEFVAITGPSGSGKSTLLGLLGLVSSPTNGRLTFQGREIESMPPNELAFIRNREIGFVFQSFQLLDRTTALENVELPMIYANVASPKRRELATQALEQVGLAHRMDHYPNQLSGGEQQRAAIARAIVNCPSVILADEPTGALDSTAGNQVMNLLQSLNQQGTTVIIVTHNLDLVSEVDQHVRISDGCTY